jgi:hypothetical protein
MRISFSGDFSYNAPVTEFSLSKLESRDEMGEFFLAFQGGFEKKLWILTEERSSIKYSSPRVWPL